MPISKPATVNKEKVAEAREAVSAPVEKEPTPVVDAESAEAALDSQIDTRSEAEAALAEMAAEDDNDGLEAEPAEDPIVAGADEIANAPAVAASTGIAVKRTTGLQALINSIAEESGMEDLAIGFNSFTNVKLQQEFEASGGVVMKNDGFDVLVLGSRAKYAVSSAHAKEEERDTVFIYDLAEIRDPNSAVAQKISDWKMESVEYTTKKYSEVYCIMIDDRLDGDAAGTLNGNLCTLSIPPTSIERLGGYNMKLKLKQRTVITKVVTRVFRGTKVQNVAFPFYPWDFRFERKANEEELSFTDLTVEG